MITRNKIFNGMKEAEVHALMEREDTKAFLHNVRTALTEKRALSGAGLLVPEVFLGMIRENIEEYSKLYAHCNVRQLSGDGREVVMGTIPEAVWTDCCGTLNELDLAFKHDAEAIKNGLFYMLDKIQNVVGCRAAAVNYKSRVLFGNLRSADGKTF